MHNSTWAALLRHIPAEQHNQFTIMTANGTEISIQSLLRIETELVMLKGRLAGTQEAGRVFIIPFRNIDSISTTQPIKDSEFHELFGSLVVPEMPATEGSDPRFDISLSPPDAAAPASPSRGSGPRPVVRSEVLERFRSRSGGPPSSANLPRPNDL